MISCSASPALLQLIGSYFEVIQNKGTEGRLFQHVKKLPKYLRRKINQMICHRPQISRLRGLRPQNLQCTFQANVTYILFLQLHFWGLNLYLL